MTSVIPSSNIPSNTTSNILVNPSKSSNVLGHILAIPSMVARLYPTKTRPIRPRKSRKIGGKMAFSWYLPLGGSIVLDHGPRVDLGAPWSDQIQSREARAYGDMRFPQDSGLVFVDSFGG